MGEMVDRVAMWLNHREATRAETPMVPWPELSGEQKRALRDAARDLVLTMRRPTLEMRVKGRAVKAKADEGETWRAMVDGALHEKD